MHIVVAGYHGRIHHAAGHSAMQKTRPVYAFVLLEYFDGEKFDRSKYLASRWPSVNAGANPNAIGSHVIPDTTRPVDLQSRCLMLVEFLQKIESIACIKIQKQL